MNRIIHLLKNCTSAAHIHQIQAQIIHHHHRRRHLHLNITVAHHFIAACQSFSLLTSAYLLYTRHLNIKPHVLIRNALIKSLTPRSSISFYTHMHSNSIYPNKFTFPLVLKSLSVLKDTVRGKSVHTHIVKSGLDNDIYVENSLMSLYSSCAEMGLCRQVFDEMSQRDVVSWTILLTGYRQCGDFNNALLTFEQMHHANVVPNQVTMVNALATCASCGNIEIGVWIHEFIKENSWELDVILGTSLINMYGKCGRIQDALTVFLSMEEKNVYTWNSLIKGLAMAKHVEEVLWWFSRMEQEECMNIKPNEVTLVVVLSTCAHFGLVQKGTEIFSLLFNGNYGFLPNAKHYACLVDLLARVGYLKEAMEVIKKMPFEPSKSVWGALFAGCRAHGDFEMSEFAGWNLVKLDPNNVTWYFELCSLYTCMGKWSELERVQALMRANRLKSYLESNPVKLDPNNVTWYFELCSLYTCMGKLSELERVQALMRANRLKSYLEIAPVKSKYMISY